MDALQLRDLVVAPTLEFLELPSQEVATNLLMGTAAIESRLGHYVHQIQGPALGIFQMEPMTYMDIWKNYLDYHSSIATHVRQLAGYRYLSHRIPPAEMIGNMNYACAMARIHYWRKPQALPTDPADIVGLAKYWKEHYNTKLGKGKVEDFIRLFPKEILE